MQRRNFITGTVATAAVLALPMGHDSADCYAAQGRLNTFSDDDTLPQRVEKLNALMGTKFTLHLDKVPELARDDPKWRAECEAMFVNCPAKHVFDDPKEEGGMGDVGWRVSLWQDGKRFTGCMGVKPMFHWTAQIALGYRMAKEQAG